MNRKTLLSHLCYLKHVSRTTTSEYQPLFNELLKYKAELCSSTLQSARTISGFTGSPPKDKGPAESRQAVPPLARTEDILRLCCKSLGREYSATEKALAKRLDMNWFSTAKDVAAMSREDAKELRVPLRMLDWIQNALAGRRRDPPPDSSEMTRKADAHPTAQGNVEEGALLERMAAGTLASALSTPHVLELADDLMKRRCPPFNRFNHGSYRSLTVIHNKKTPKLPYAIHETDMSPELVKDFKQLHTFLTTRFYGQQQDPMLPVTAKKYGHYIRLMLGWLHHHKKVPLEEISFAAIFPGPGRHDARAAFEYLQWLTDTRGVNSHSEAIVLRALGALAKYMYHSQSKTTAGDGFKRYQDLEVVCALRGLSQATQKRARIEAPVSAATLKWLDWPDFLKVVQELKKECAGLDADGKERSPASVAWSLQRYLVLAILSCVPDRQRTLRELEVGRTLIKDGSRWVIKHTSADYKTGKSYGERPPLVIAPDIYPELEAFLSTWRKELGPPQHNLLFSQISGAPLTTNDIFRLVTLASFRLSGKRTNPHLIRDMIVTHLRGTDASERQMEALSIYMGHSLEMQRGSYDRRTKAVKVEPAVDLLASINSMALRKSRRL